MNDERGRNALLFFFNETHPLSLVGETISTGLRVVISDISVSQFVEYEKNVVDIFHMG